MIDLEEVKQDGLVLEHVENQTHEICLEATKQDWWVLRFVREQTPKLLSM